MTFPAQPLDTVVEIAPGVDPAADPRSYSWVDVSQWWRHAGPIRIARGKASPLAETVPAECTLELDNTDGRFTPRNPLGPYYPDLQRNTPLRIRLRWAYDLFGRTASSGWGSADSGQAWATSGGAASDYSVADGVGKQSIGTVNTLRTSLLDVGLANHRLITDVVLPVVPSGAAYTLWAAVRVTDLSNYYTARLTVATSGAVTLELLRHQSGTLSSALASAVLGTHTAGQRWRIAVDVAGSRLRAKAWRVGVDLEPQWLVEATDTLLPAGSQVGVLARAEAGNTNGTQVVTWDSLDVSHDRFTGYVDRWPPRWDPSGTLQWVPVSAHGTLRRIASAGDSARSALYRYITERQALFLAAYWPMEDGASATEPASGVRAIGPMAPSKPVRFGVASPSSGVGTMVDTSGAYLHARLPSVYALDWRVECVVAHEAVPGATVRVLSWLCPGTIGRWDLNTTPTGFTLVGLTAVSGGSTVISLASGVVAQPGQLHHLRVDVTWSGSTNTAKLYVDGVLAGTGTHSPSTTSRPTVIRVNPDAATDHVPAVGHVAMWAATPLPSTDSATAALGNPGETAQARIGAVCEERDVPYEPWTLTTVQSQAMGPRPAVSLTAQLREAEATDAGLLYEMTSGHVTYRPRSTLYNQDPALFLDYEQRHVVEMEPSDDDAQLRNDVTARRPSGSEARYVDEGLVAAVGRYETSLSVNPADDADLLQSAAWAVHRGSATEQRFDVISLRMRAGADVVDGWLGCDIGSRVSVANVPAEVTPDAVDVLMVGYVETILFPATWTVDMVCEPASSWTVGELNQLDVGRLASAGSQLTTGNVSVQIRGDASNRAIVSTGDVVFFAVGNRVALYDSAGRRKEPTTFVITSITGPAFGVYDMFLDPLPAETIRGNFTGDYDRIRKVDETSLSVATTSGPVWTQDPGHMPFDINVAGERMTVTAVSGASSPQTFTVVRAVNGVEKGHPADSAVQLWQPLILGL